MRCDLKEKRVAAEWVWIKCDWGSVIDSSTYEELVRYRVSSDLWFDQALEFVDQSLLINAGVFFEADIGVNAVAVEFVRIGHNRCLSYSFVLGQVRLNFRCSDPMTADCEESSLILVFFEGFFWRFFTWHWARHRFCRLSGSDRLRPLTLHHQ